MSDYIQLKTPAIIPYVGGLCEGFVEGSWGQATIPTVNNQHTSGVFGNAVNPVNPGETAAWKTNYGNGNHPNKLPPAGFYVPVYFSLGSTPAGHVAYIRPDGTVVSSTQAGFHPSGYIHPNLNDLIQVYRQANGSCTYLGWSEYVGKVKVIERNDMKVQDNKLDYNVLSQTFKDCTGRPLNQTEFKQQVGRNWQDVLITFQGSKETAAWTKKAKATPVSAPSEAQSLLDKIKAIIHG